MGWLLLLIVGGSIVLSGVVAGLALVIHNVTGVAFPRLFGGLAQKHDLGVIPVLLLKTGIFSVPAIWGAFLMGFGSRAEITLLYGVGSGALLALVDVLLIKLLTRFKRIGFELLGLIVGLVIGGIIGMIATLMIGIDIPMSIEGKLFLGLGVGIGTVAGVLNGRSLSKILTRTTYHAIACEITTGSLVVGLAGSSFLFYAFYRFGGRTDIFDWFLFTLGPLAIGCLFGGCCLLAQYGLVLPCRYGIRAILSRLFQSRPIRSPFLINLLFLLLLAGTTGGIILGVIVGIQYAWASSFQRIAILERKDQQKISVIEPTPDGGYLLGGQAIVKIDHQGRQVWIKSDPNPLMQGVRMIRTTFDGGAVAVIGNDDRSVVKLDRQGYKEWEYISSHDRISAIESTSNHGYLLGGYIQKKNEPQYQVVKLDSSGHEIWTSVFIGVIRDLQATSDGGYFLLGAEYPNYNSGAFKFNTEGQLIWKSLGICCNLSLLADSEPPGEGYLVTGIRYDGNSNRTISLIRKLNPEGQEVWNQSNEDSDTLYIFGITPDKKPLIGKMWKSFAWEGMNMGPGIKYHMNLSQLNSQGKQLWTRTLNLRLWGIILVTADNAHILFIEKYVGQQWPRIVGCNSQGEQLWNYTLIPDRGMMSWLYGQSAQMWEAFFTVNNDLFTQWNIRRATSRTIGYPPLQFFEKRTVVLNDSIQITPDGGVEMLIEVQGKNKDNETWVVKFTPPKIPHGIRQ